MADNHTELWDKVRRVPSEHLKPFDNGKFKGTAIKPMWAVKVMTEIYGPMGTGWGVLAYSYRTEDAGESRLVFCEMTVWYGTREHTVHGIGGDWLVRNGKGDDEALKKAFTDALTNALKHLGVAADIHMNLWDGSKYKDEKPAETPTEVVSMPSAQGTQGASKAGNREAYDNLVKGIRNAPTVKLLGDWHKENVTEIDKLPPDWVDELRIEYNDRKAELTRVLAA